MRVDAHTAREHCVNLFRQRAKGGQHRIQGALAVPGVFYQPAPLAFSLLKDVMHQMLLNSSETEPAGQGSGQDLAGSKGVQRSSTFFLTPAPVLAERVAIGGGSWNRFSPQRLPG